MPADTPAVLVALIAQPVMAEDLSVEVVRLVRCVVHVELGSCVLLTKIWSVSEARPCFFVKRGLGTLAVDLPWYRKKM